MEPFPKTLIDDLLDNYLNENCKFDEESGELLDDLESDTFDVNNFNILEEKFDLLDENYPLDEASNNRDHGSILADNQESNCFNSECTNVQSPSRNKEQINSEQPQKSILGISNADYSNKSNSIHKVADVDTISNKENQNEKPTDALCLEYNKQYDNPGSITGYHMQIGGDNDKLFKCTQCDYKCSESGLLQKHKRRMHANGEVIECSKCNKRFKTILSCQRHEKICGKDPALTCTLCSFKTHFKYVLKRHLESHEKIYQKTVQNSEASVAIDLLNDNRKHELYSGISKFQASFQRYCPKCRENFENNLIQNPRKCKNCKTQLLMRCMICKSLHKNVKAIRYHLQHKCILRTNFECSTCDYSTTHRKYLMTHIQRKHAKVDSQQFYKCSKCCSSFLTKQSLKKHIRNSCTSDKPYLLCDHCPFKTKTKCALGIHIKSAHMANKNSVRVSRNKKTTNVESRNDLVDNYLNNYSRFDDESGKLSDKLESDAYAINNCDIIEERVDLLDKNYTFDEASNNRDLGSIMAENQENNCLNSECTNVQLPSRNKEQINSEQPHKSILGISNGTYSNNGNSIHKVADVDTISNKENQSEKPTDALCLEYNKQYDNPGSITGHHMQIGGDNDKLFKCTQCDYKCSALKLLQRHRRKMHADSEQIECSKCNKRFKSIYSCQRHENICGENPNFSCTLCSYKTHRKDGLKCHLETHEKIYQKTVQNNEASAALDLLNDNRKHELYSGVSKFRASFQCYCSKCRENFDNNSNLNSCKCKNCETKLLMRCIKCKSLHHSIEAIRYHWQYICSPKTKFECSTCDYSTTNTKHLKIHIQRKHTTIDPEKFYKCSECSKSFKIKQDLYVHIRNYSCMSKKPHLLCDHCPFRTKTKSALINHIKSHFVAQTATHQQALILLGNKKHERFDCENCGKAFGHSSNLDCHKKVCKSKISAQN